MGKTTGGRKLDNPLSFGAIVKRSSRKKVEKEVSVTLVRIDEKDLPQLFAWRNDKQIYFWCRQNSPLHWSAHLDWFRRQSQDPKLSMFSVLNELGFLIGVVGLTDIDLINRRAEFSCYIGPEFQGQGYATKALKSLFLHGFRDLGLNRIWGESFSGNKAVEIFTKKLGMEIEGIRKEFYYVCGSYLDAHLVSVSAPKFLGLFGDEAQTSGRA